MSSSEEQESFDLVNALKGHIVFDMRVPMRGPIPCVISPTGKFLLCANASVAADALCYLNVD